MNNYQITVAYDGAAYSGWQRLTAAPDAMPARTFTQTQQFTDRKKQNITKKENNTYTAIPISIQELLERRISAYLGHPVRLHGSGRTDAGVHAVAQTANFHTPKTISSADALNRLLPADIQITALRLVPSDFHSRKNAVSKKYAYCVSLCDKPDVFAARYVYNPACAPLSQKPDADGIFCLNLEEMKRCAALLIGTYDYSAFTSDKSAQKSHIRTVTAIDFQIQTTASGKKILVMLFEGNGFLYHMVRILAGTLLLAGCNMQDCSGVRKIRDGKKRSGAGPTLPPNALFLCGVTY